MGGDGREGTISLWARRPPISENRNGADCIESLGDVGKCCNCDGGDELTEPPKEPDGEEVGKTIASGIWRGHV